MLISSISFEISCFGSRSLKNKYCFDESVDRTNKATVFVFLILSRKNKIDRFKLNQIQLGLGTRTFLHFPMHEMIQFILVNFSNEN